MTTPRPPPSLMAFTSSLTALKKCDPSTFTSHPSLAILSSKSLSLPPKLATPLHLSSNKLYDDTIADSWKCRTRVSFFQGFSTQGRDIKGLKEELFAGIAQVDRGAEATREDKERVDQIASKLEAVNEIKEPLKSNLMNGKWELIYTTSQSILKTKWTVISDACFYCCFYDINYVKSSSFAMRPKFLRPNGKIYQAINVDTLRAQNMESWPFFNQATANLIPLNARRVAVKFDLFRIAGLIPIASPGSGRGQLEITYLDEELRISRGNEGNLFILKMVDPSYRVPL